MKVFSVCVGRFNSVSETKSIDKKLKSFGVTSYLFKIDDIYTLKVSTVVDEEKAGTLCKNLKKLGFDAFVS